MRYKVYQNRSGNYNILDTKTNKIVIFYLEDRYGEKSLGTLSYRLDVITDLKCYENVVFIHSQLISRSIKEGTRVLIGEFSELKDIVNIQSLYPEHFI